jgi:hypothetical protein
LRGRTSPTIVVEDRATENLENSANSVEKMRAGIKPWWIEMVRLQPSHHTLIYATETAIRG